MSNVDHKRLIKRYDMLINLSGGIDSTYAAYKYLKENPNKRLLLHHCVLKNFQNRWPKEKEAVAKILEYLESKGLKNFHYIESTFDYGGIGSMIHDIEVIGFMTAAILRNQNFRVEEIAITASKDDTLQPSYKYRAKSRYEIIKLVARYEPDYDFPIVEKRRREIIADMPRELLDLTWFCRTPTDSGAPCGTCSTCRQTLKHLPREAEAEA